MDDISARRQRVAQMRAQKDQGGFGWDDFLTKILLPVGVGVAGGLTGGLGLAAAAPAAAAAGGLAAAAPAAVGGLGAGLAGASAGMAAGGALGQAIEGVAAGDPARTVAGVGQAIPAATQAFTAPRPSGYEELIELLRQRRQ